MTTWVGRSTIEVEDGFSLIEMAVSLALMLIVTGVALSVVAANTTTSRTGPDVVDLQQRARVGADVLARDLASAGAGVYLGPAAGPLRKFFAPIVPRRMGLQVPDAFSVARADAITITSIPQTYAQTSLRDPLPSTAADLRIELVPNCPPGDALCGLAAGAAIVLFDREGHFDFFTLSQVLTDSGRVRSWQPGDASFSYPAGAVVAEAEWHTYYFDAANRQLRHFDGYLTDTPVIDDVVGVSFEYFGDPLPPTSPKPPLGMANCLYEVDGNPAAGLSVLSTQGGSLAPLPLGVFADGPWCGAGNNRFDADLLRIRKVRVTLRLQVGNDMLRGRSADFAIPGRSRSAARSLPDYTLRFDLSPRSLSRGR